MRRCSRVLVLVVALCLLTSTPAGAAVGIVSFTSHVGAGDYASISVRVSPAARCTITVVYDTVVSRARGLGPKSGSSITWRWRVGTSTHAGRWPVKIDCGRSGRLTRMLAVR